MNPACRSGGVGARTIDGGAHASTGAARPLQPSAGAPIQIGMSLSFVDRCYVINLPARTDRRREIREQFARIGWNADDDAIRYFDAVKPEDAGPFPSIGARGCFLSHLGILQEAAAFNLKAIAIFEDDLDFARDFNARVGDAAAALERTDWAIFYGGYETQSPLESDGLIVRVGPDTQLRTTHFVCFQGDAISLARDYLEAMLARPAGDPRGGPMHVDGAYQWFRRAYPDYACYAATPPLGVQRSSASDVTPKRWFDQTPALRSMAQALRRLRRSLTG